MVILWKHLLIGALLFHLYPSTHTVYFNVFESRVMKNNAQLLLPFHYPLFLTNHKQICYDSLVCSIGKVVVGQILWVHIPQ